MQKKIIYGKIVNSSKSKIALSKKVIEFASSYYDKIERIQHVETTGQVHYFYANNKLIAAYLKKDLTYTAFKKLFDLCKMNGVFDLSFNKHIPCVTFNAAAKHMTRKWTRDHSGMMPLIKDKYPNEAWAGLLE